MIPEVNDQDRLLAKIVEEKLPLIDRTVRRRIRRFGLRLDDFDDLKQTILLKVVELIRRRPVHVSLLDPWLKRVATNITFEYLRSVVSIRQNELEQQQDSYYLDKTCEQFDVIKTLIHEEDRKAFRAAVESLPEIERQVLAASLFEGTDIQAASIELQCARGTFYSNLRKAKIRTHHVRALGLLAGVLQNVQGIPLVGLRIHLQGIDACVNERCVTNRYGRFEFCSLPIGYYLIAVDSSAVVLPLPFYISTGLNNLRVILSEKELHVERGTNADA